MKARDYQLEAVAKVRTYFRAGHYYALVHMPTGAGKSVMAVEFIRQVLTTYPEYRVCIIIPKLAIIESFVRTVHEMLPTTSVTVAAASSHGKDLQGQVVVASFQTLSRMKELPVFDLVICDEAHKINERDQNSEYLGVIKRIMASGTTRCLALTATPFRDTGYIYGPDKLFKELVFTRDLLWTTEMGFTVKAVLWSGREHSFDTTRLTVDNTGEYAARDLTELSANEPKARAQVSDIIFCTTSRKKIAIACANIKHAELIKGILEESNEGEVEIVHSEQDWEEREISLGKFQEEATTRFLVFVSIVAEGFDYPPIDAIAILRPTRRANLYIQVVGRGLRISPETGKVDCLVLDYGNVVKNCGPLNAPFINTVGGKRGLEKAQALADVEVVQCLSCGGFYFPLKGTPDPKCTHCETVHVRPAPDPGKKLLKKTATDAELYGYTIDKKKRVPRETVTFTVDRVEYFPLGTTTMANHESKRIIIYAKEYPKRFFKITIHNPAIPSPDRDNWKIFKDREAEPKLQKFLSDVQGQWFDIRSIRLFTLTPKDNVQLTCSVKGDGSGWTEYKSHEVVPTKAATPLELSLFGDYSAGNGEDT